MIFSKQTCYLGLLILCSSIVVLINSIFSSDGYLTPDSTRYLAVAKNIIEGNGFNVSSISLDGEEKEYFAIWPLGYPLLIALVAKISGLSVFIASKMVNLIFVALSFLMVFRIFKKDAHIFACILLFGAYLQLFSHSWSEVPFIFGLLWFCSSINNYLNHNSKFYLLHLLAAGMFLFLMRYIGAFSFCVIGLLALWRLKQRLFVDFVYLLLLSIVGFIFIGLYLYNNVIETGWLTGKERLPSFETNFQLALMVFKAFAQEAIVLTGHDKSTFLWMTLIQFAVIGYVWFTIKKTRLISTNAYSEREEGGKSLSHIFLLVGGSYYLAIILSRWFTQFDYLNYRLLAPGTLLLFFAILLEIQQGRSTLLYSRIKRIIILLTAISVVSNTLVPFIKYQIAKEPLSYQQKVLQISNEYNVIPEHSILIFADNNIRYLRTSLILARPDFIPFAKSNEPVDQFLRRVTSNYPDKKIYIVTDQQTIKCKRLHESWCKFLKLNAGQRFHQIQ